jgi:hypothetical protein
VNGGTEKVKTVEELELWTFSIIIIITFNQYYMPVSSICCENGSKNSYATVDP